MAAGCVLADPSSHSSLARARVVDGRVAHRIGAAELGRVRRRGHRRAVVLVSSGERRAQRSVLDEAWHIEFGEVTDRLQVRHITFQRLDQRRFERGVERRATGTVVEVHHLLRQARRFGDDLGGLQRLQIEEVRGVELGLQEGVEYFRMFGGVCPSNDNTVKRRIVQFRAVVEQLALALKDQQARPRHELRKCLHLTGFQCRRADLRLLVEHLDARARD